MQSTAVAGAPCPSSHSKPWANVGSSPSPKLFGTSMLWKGKSKNAQKLDRRTWRIEFPGSNLHDPVKNSRKTWSEYQSFVMLSNFQFCIFTWPFPLLTHGGTLTVKAPTQKLGTSPCCGRLVESDHTSNRKSKTSEVSCWTLPRKSFSVQVTNLPDSETRKLIWREQGPTPQHEGSNSNNISEYRQKWIPLKSCLNNILV